MHDIFLKYCFLKMYCLEESTLNLSMIVRHRKHHFVFLFVVMNFKFNNLKLCSQIKGLFVSAHWNHKVIVASISLSFHQKPGTVLSTEHSLSH